MERIILERGRVVLWRFKACRMMAVSVTGCCWFDCLLMIFSLINQSAGQGDSSSPFFINEAYLETSFWFPALPESLQQRGEFFKLSPYRLALGINFHFHYTANHDQSLMQLQGMQSLSRYYKFKMLWSADAPPAAMIRCGGEGMPNLSAWARIERKWP